MYGGLSGSPMIPNTNKSIYPMDARDDLDFPTKNKKRPSDICGRRRPRPDCVFAVRQLNHRIL